MTGCEPWRQDTSSASSAHRPIEAQALRASAPPRALGARGRCTAAVDTVRDRVRWIVVVALVAALAAVAGGLVAPEPRGGREQGDVFVSNGHIEPDDPIGRS
jgi:hypothetical protein